MSSQSTSRPASARRGSAPWKRGPVAWQIGTRADDILKTLRQQKRRFLSLRRTAAMLDVSTQPVRDWICSGWLKADGPRGQIAATELRRFVCWLDRHATFYDMGQRSGRFRGGRDAVPLRHGTLARSTFSWPRNEKTLRPRELARRIGCHPSLIGQALRDGRVMGGHPTPHRWEITRASWLRAFPGTLTEKS